MSLTARFIRIYFFKRDLGNAALDYEWDEAKNWSNRREHGIDFEAVDHFEWNTAVIDIDDREDYGELRERAIGFIGNSLHVLIFTNRDDRIRVISLRKAEKPEQRHYVEEARRR